MKKSANTQDQKDGANSSIGGISNVAHVRPEWGDAKAVQSRFGICKSTLYRLTEDGKIRSSSLRERGKLRGKRLFSMDSVAAYIESMASGGECDEKAGSKS